MTFKDRALAVIDAAICLANRVWRPMVCVGAGFTMFLVSIAIIQVIAIGFINRQPVDTAALGQLVTSMATMAGVMIPFAIGRTWEKIKELQAKVADAPRDPPF